LPPHLTEGDDALPPSGLPRRLLGPST